MSDSQNSFRHAMQALTLLERAAAEGQEKAQRPVGTEWAGGATDAQSQARRRTMAVDDLVAR